jgi:hypothetical protein
MPDTGNAGMTIGDCAVNFIADMTNLDQGVDKLNDRIESGMTRASQNVGQLGDALDETGAKAGEAANEVEESMSKSSVNIREARGEVALLGEEFGVRLPRHVQTFVAEMPGVGEALEAAFSATAVLFVLEAVVKLTEKVTDFISTTFIYTQAMKDADKATADLNATVLANEANIVRLNAAYDAMTMTPMQLLTKQLDDVNAKIAHQQEEFRAASDEMYGYRNGLIQLTDAEKKQSENIIISNKTVMESLTDENRNLSTQIDKLYSDGAKKAKELADKNMATFNELMLQQRNYAGQLILDWNNMAEAIMRLPAAANTAGAVIFQGLNPAFVALENGQKAAKNLGITLRTDLISDITFAQKEMDAFAASGIKDAKAMDAFVQKLKEAKQALRDYDTGVKQVSTGMAAAIEFSGKLESNLAAAFIAAATGEEAWGKAMEAATGKAITAFGEYCQIKATAALAAAMGGDTSMWASAAEWEAAAIAAGIAGAEISGAAGGGAGGGGGRSYSGTGTTGNVTSGSGAAPGPQTTTTRLFAGGLVSAPTMAMIGDTAMGGDANEAVLPLDHPDSMAKIAAAIAPHLAGMMGDGGTHFHVNVKGLVSDDTLSNIMTKMSKKVNKGTGSLLSSNTHRVTKRSA